MANPQEQLANQQQQLTVLMGELNTLRADLATNQQALQALNAENQRLKQSQEGAEQALLAVQGELQSVRNENQQLKQGQLGLAGVEGQIKDLSENIKEMNKKKDATHEQVLVDIKGIGKPEIFKNEQSKFTGWVRKIENFIVSIFGEEFREVLEWALGHEQAITKSDWDNVYGAGGDEIDRVENLEHKISQVYQALMSLTEEETQDLVIGAGSGNGLEAWRKINRRWDPIIAGRRNALLKAIIGPTRAKIGDLISRWEKWEEQIRRFEKSKDADGCTEKLSNSVKMTAFQALLPENLENHLVLNRKRINTYEEQKEEINMILDNQLGSSMRPPGTGGGTPMDLDAFTKGGKGKGKDGFQGNRNWNNHRKGGNQGRGWKGGGKGKGQGGNPWYQQGQGNQGKDGNRGKGKGREKGKDKGKAKGGKGKGKDKGNGANSLEDADGGGAGTGEANALDLGALDLVEVESLDLEGAWEEMETEFQSEWDNALNGLCPLYYGDEEGEPPLCSMDEQWIKLNYDSGAAVTAFPKSGVPQNLVQSSSSSSYKTAGGQLVPDLGGVKLTAEDENGQLRRVQGRVSEVHKSLISASKSAQMGQNGWLTKGGGWLVPENSRASEKIHKILQEESEKEGNKMIPLYEERGVYNFYLKMTPGKGKMEASGSQGPKDLQSLTKEELINEVSKLRSESAGFPRQS